MLPTDDKERKATPMATGCLDYFPDALAAVARLSKIGNDKHNPGEPLHWSRGKSSDHADCLVRHLADRGTLDANGELHDVEVAWRALALCQLALERHNQIRAPREARVGVSWSEPSTNGVITSAAVPPPAPKPRTTFWYLATPYSLYPDGHEAAARMACEYASTLMLAGVPVFAPIAHSHSIAVAGIQDKQVDHDFWMRADAPFMATASGLIVVLEKSWSRSKGMLKEIDTFIAARKPIVWWAPGTPVPPTLLRP